MFGRNQTPAGNPEVTDDGQPKTNADGTPKKSDAELLAETVTGAITKLGETVSAVVGKVDALEQRFQQKPNQNETKHEQPQFASVFEDEDAAIGQRVVAALGPVYQQQLEMQADINREKVLKEFVAKGF